MLNVLCKIVKQQLLKKLSKLLTKLLKSAFNLTAKVKLLLVLLMSSEDAPRKDKLAWINVLKTLHASKLVLLMLTIANLIKCIQS